jgi:predicted DNA-binding transcriptional regulator YafY
MAGKNQLLRVLVLDELLRKEHKSSMRELITACKDNEYYNRVVFHEDQEVVSERTIRDDLKFMRDVFGAPIPNRNAGELYQYTDTSFSIFQSPILQSELEVLQLVSGLLGQFTGLGLSDDLNQMIERASRLSWRATSEDYNIDFGLKPYPKGQEWLRAIFQAIVNRKKVDIKYQPFEKEAENSKNFCPYLLKQYNRRWYVLGQSELREGITNYALDRIKHVKQQKHTYTIPKGFIEKYFNAIVGVTLLPDKPVEDVHITLKKPFSYYVISKPLHHSQKVVSETAEYHVFNYSLRYNKELVSILMSYGQNILDLKPDSIKQELLNEAKLLSNNLS